MCFIYLAINTDANYNICETLGDLPLQANQKITNSLNIQGSLSGELSWGSFFPHCLRAQRMTTRL